MQEHLKADGDLALEVRMHPSILEDCLDCEYNEVISAFRLSPSQSWPPKYIFSTLYPLKIDSNLNDNEWLIQPPLYESDCDEH